MASPRGVDARKSALLDDDDANRAPRRAATMRARRCATRATRETLGRFARGALARADAERAAVTATASGTRARDEWTYGELLDRALTFARALEDLGYDASSRPLGVGTGNAMESVAAYLGTALAGDEAREARGRRTICERCSARDAREGRWWRSKTRRRRAR